MRRVSLLLAAGAMAPHSVAAANDSAFAPSLAGRDRAARAAALECLTQAIYYEARNQSADGQRAVAQVVLNRVRHPSYPDDVCGVVFQGSERTTGCQFSFTCDGSMNAGVTDLRSWARAGRIAEAALNGSVYAPVGEALNYHTTAIRPYWAPSLVRQAVVGDHIFYRRPSAPAEVFTQERVERPIEVEETEWSSRDSARLRRALRTTRSSARLRYAGEPVLEIPVLEQPITFRTEGSRASRTERAPRRRAASFNAGPRLAYESGVRVTRGR